ncbi:hypothetical protein BpHYR1_009749 [Brachionus plicatilis]|uniref:Uncharacterized protein n=1 Tax=Brachionus plicatilis TaxID=10195 RepID=A0A3M7SBQ5_BRAPC|nr:hypothetical protein BpHYR1_009749 [Brachionus plicatilis]
MIGNFCYISFPKKVRIKCLIRGDRVGPLSQILNLELNILSKNNLFKKLAVDCYSGASTCATTWRLKSPTAFMLQLLLKNGIS